MATKKTKRIFAGYYRRYDLAYVEVLTVIDEFDTGSKVVIFMYDDRKHYDGKNYSMTIESFCEDIEVNGIMVSKFTRCTKRERDTYLDDKKAALGINQPRKHRKKLEASDRRIRECRRCASYEDYAKDICTCYNEDLNRYNKTVQAKRWVGVMGKTEFKALSEDLSFLKDCFRTSLKDYHPLFKKRFIEGLSIRKCASELGISKGSVEYKERKMLSELAGLLKHRDEVDQISRLRIETEFPSWLKSLEETA